MAKPSLEISFCHRDIFFHSGAMIFFQDKGSVSARSAGLKAEIEYEIFNRTQKIDSDFDREVRKMLEGMKGNE